MAPVNRAGQPGDIVVVRVGHRPVAAVMSDNGKCPSACSSTLMPRITGIRFRAMAFPVSGSL